MRKKHFFFGLMAVLWMLAGTSAEAQESGVISGDALKMLNRIIETAKDGEQGYQTAARDIQDVRLKDKFRQISEQRGRFADELTQSVRELGAEPRTEGSLGAAFHRGWINFKSSITGEDRKSIISEIETGENVAVEVYEEALQKDLPAEVFEMVRQQALAVKENFQEIQNLKNQLQYEESAEKSKDSGSGMERRAAGAVDSKAPES